MPRKRFAVVSVEALMRVRLALTTCMSPLAEWEYAETFPEMIQARAALAELDAVLNRRRKAKA